MRRIPLFAVGNIIVSSIGRLRNRRWEITQLLKGDFPWTTVCLKDIESNDTDAYSTEDMWCCTTVISPAPHLTRMQSTLPDLMTADGDNKSTTLPGLHYLDDMSEFIAVEPKCTGDNHNWTMYQGLVHSFEYCKDCDLKREVVK